MNKRSIIVRTVIVLCCIIIFSCRKDFKNIFEQQNQIPSTILEEAKIWHAKNATLTQGIVSSLNSKAAPIKTRFIRLEPLWGESWMVPSYPGNKLLIVPTRENKITNPLLKIRRVFIFPIINNKVAGGEIIDIIGFNFDVSANLDYILSNYTSDKINNFNGAIIRYDLNYYFLNSAKYNQGIKTNEKVRINKVPVADTQIKTSKTLSAKGLGTVKAKSVSSFGSSSDGTGSGGGLGPCTAVYYYFYQLDSEGYKIFEEWTFLYYEGNCSGQDTSNPGTGTNTNYTGTGPGGGGGGGYGGNTATIANNVTNQCMHETVDKVLDPNGINRLQYALYNLFNSSTFLNLNISQSSSISDYGTTTAITRSGITNINITLNDQILPGSSKEFTAAVVIHEVLHAYMFANGLTANMQHEAMAVSYINQVSGLLKSLYPNLSDTDAQALSWGGLAGTGSWSLLSNMSPTYTDSLVDIQIRHTLGQLGSKCN